MPKIIQDEQGNEVEVYTVEELEAQRQQAVEEFKSSNPDKSGEMESLQEQLQKAQEELGEFRTKDLNFSSLRTQQKIAESKVERLVKEMNEKIEEAKQGAKREVLETVMKGHYEDSLNTLAGNDAELQKKIEFHYKRLQDVAGTKEEITKKLTDAWLLATRSEEQGALNATAVASGGVAGFPPRAGEKKFTEDEKVFTQKLARAGGMELTEKDFKK